MVTSVSAGKQITLRRSFARSGTARAVCISIIWLNIMESLMCPWISQTFEKINYKQQTDPYGRRRKSETEKRQPYNTENLPHCQIMFQYSGRYCVLSNKGRKVRDIHLFFAIQNITTRSGCVLEWTQNKRSFIQANLVNKKM